MDKQQIISKVADEVKAKFLGEGSGHDWWHIYRVWQMAKHIAATEQGDLFIIELGALLHDIADYKFHGGSEEAGPLAARELLSKYGLDEKQIEALCHIVAHVSFKGAAAINRMETLEGKIVQDADRLDAIGAIGIARAFAYGGSRNRPMHDPETKPIDNLNKDEYIKRDTSAINHFYEKLLLTKDRMNTATGKQLAENRHQYTQEYVDRFLQEWEGKL